MSWNAVSVGPKTGLRLLGELVAQPGEKTVLSGTRPSREEQFYLEWGRETLKANLTVVNGVLGNLLMLDGALLGGSIMLLDAEVVGSYLRVVVAGLFLLSLFVSFLGVLPYGKPVDPRVPSEIRDHKTRALHAKLRYLWVAAAFDAAGFGVAVVGLLMRAGG